MFLPIFSNFLILPCVLKTKKIVCPCFGCLLTLAGLNILEKGEKKRYKHMGKDESSLYTFCSLPQEQISLAQMNPLYLYQCSPLGRTCGSMHVLGLGELVCFLSSDAVAYFVFGWRDRESRMRHQTCRPQALFSFLPFSSHVLCCWTCPRLALSCPTHQNTPTMPVATKPTHTHHYSS